MLNTSAVPLADVRDSTRAHAIAAPWHVYAVLFASACVILGVMWDISWHTTIGRDSFWTPAHMVIYLGGVVAGVACGWLALRITIAGTAGERASSVHFWHYFQAPLGAWVCIWGTFAMLTSAPFDNWWHNAYGLDVQILSPPHTVLALGIGAIQLGALLMTLAPQNRAGAASHTAETRYGTLYAVAAGLLLLNAAIMSSEYLDRINMHRALFYEIAGGIFPLYLVALARGARVTWPATTIAVIYTGVVLAMVWMLPLFPAQPRLGPIYQNVTHMVPPDFPLLLILPAIALDVIVRRFGQLRSWLLAPLLGAAFLAVFLVAQWTFGYFLNSPYSQNWVFATNNYFYGLSKNSHTYRHQFLPDSSFGRQWGYAIALALSMASAWVGLTVGSWLRRVRR